MILRMCDVAGKEAALGSIWPKIVAIKELAGVEDDQSDDETTAQIYMRLASCTQTSQ